MRNSQDFQSNLGIFIVTPLERIKYFSLRITIEKKVHLDTLEGPRYPGNPLCNNNTKPLGQVSE